MIVTTTYERPTPNSSIGHILKVTQTYTSFDENEIDIIEKALKSKINDGCSYEVDVFGSLGGEEE